MVWKYQVGNIKIIQQISFFIVVNGTFSWICNGRFSRVEEKLIWWTDKQSNSLKNQTLSNSEKLFLTVIRCN